VHLYHDGELDPHQAAHFTAHLEQCAQCRALLSELQSLSGLFALMPAPQPAPGFENRVRARIQNNESETLASPHGADMGRWYRKLCAAAACLALVFCSLLTLHSQETPPLEILAPHQVAESALATNQKTSQELYKYVLTGEQSALLEQDDDQTLNLFYSSLEKNIM
jgi:anti-sigma factor RsiW